MKHFQLFVHVIGWPRRIVALRRLRIHYLYRDPHLSFFFNVIIAYPLLPSVFLVFMYSSVFVRRISYSRISLDDGKRKRPTSTENKNFDNLRNELGNGFPDKTFLIKWHLRILQI